MLIKASGYCSIAITDPKPPARWSGIFIVAALETIWNMRGRVRTSSSRRSGI